MRIVVVSAEVSPWAKTGGLGDVCGALPKALAGRGHLVTTVSPRYKNYPDAWDTGVRARFHLFGMDHEVGFHHCQDEAGAHHIFVDHPSYQRPGIYGDSSGAYGDNLFRFALLSRAAIEAAARVPLNGECVGEDVVFHINDWHTALLPLYLKAIYQPAGRFLRAATVLGLHNLGHHGTSAAHTFAGLDVSARWWPALDFGGNLNVLKTGLTLADKLVAVSPTYAREITDNLGFGLEGMLAARRGDLVGILNGIDATWDPATDPHIAANYTPEDLSGKLLCKTALQRRMGLAVRPDTPLFGVVARLDHQKGIDLISELTPWLVRQEVQLVVLGSGSRELSEFFRGLSANVPRQVGAHIGFDEALAHQIEAGADAFLMPSRFEPCGLNQLYSMRYGTPPIVHATGGLADTVETWSPATGRGTGWAFRPLSVEALREAIGWALYTYRKHPDAWQAIQLNGMRRDSSWNQSALRYEAVYRAALGE